MNVVFTGTRLGMTDKQREVVRRLLLQFAPETVLHGGCMGADWHFHEIVCSMRPRPQVMVYPSNMPGTYPVPIRAYAKLRDGSEFERLARVWVMYGATWVAPEAHPLARNKEMLKASQKIGDTVLVACPKEGDEELVQGGRGGTLATIREAGRRGVQAEIVAFDGLHWTRPSV